ncbi:MAG: hypothetical protein JWN86_1786 [Planctomycetota bacterium]|nr:hypothetical protein [Planctomycetota bacterium]
MFFRIYKSSSEGRRELILNSDHITKIEVEYSIPSKVEGKTVLFSTSVQLGSADPNAVRNYKVFVGGEVLNLRSNPNDPVLNHIEEIYRNSIKGNGGMQAEAEAV